MIKPKKTVKVSNYTSYMEKIDKASEKKVIEKEAPILLTKEEMEFYEERAAIIEFEAGVPRDQAETEALKLTLRFFRRITITLPSNDHCFIKNLTATSNLMPT